MGFVIEGNTLKIPLNDGAISNEEIEKVMKEVINKGEGLNLYIKDIEGKERVITTIHSFSWGSEYQGVGPATVYGLIRLQPDI